MNEAEGPPAGTPEDDSYRAGWLAGHAARQVEVDELETLADRYYRAAFDDERRIPREIVSYEELEQRRRLSEPPREVTRSEALASWGIDEDPPARTVTVQGSPSPAGTTNRSSRRSTMSTRIIIGNLASDPEAVQAGRVQIVKLRVVENTGEYRQGAWVEHEAPTTHFVEAKFELGQNTLDTLHKGDAVIVVGQEHTVSWGQGAQKRYGRVIDADAIGPNLTRATATIQRRSTPTPA